MGEGYREGPVSKEGPRGAHQTLETTKGRAGELEGKQQKFPSLKYREYKRVKIQERMSKKF